MTVKNFANKLSYYRDFAIDKLIFLVKPIGSVSKTCFFTQFVLPDVRPLKVYFKSRDVTRLLTFKNNLTQFSYEFLCGIAYEESFRFGEIRSFFHVNNKSTTIKKMRKDLRPTKNSPPLKRVSFQMGTGIPGTIASEAPAAHPPAADAVQPSTDEPSVLPVLGKRHLEDVDDVPLAKRVMEEPEGVGGNPSPDCLITASGVSFEALPAASEDFLTKAFFSKRPNFIAALRLVALNIMPGLRFPQSRYEMYYELSRQARDDKILFKFKRFLELEMPSLLKPSNMLQVVNDYISFGGISMGERTAYYHTTLDIVEMRKPEWFCDIAF